MRWLIKNARLLDPGIALDCKGDLLVENGTISKVGGDIPVEGDATVVDGEGLVVTPSYIDLHVHLREPGQEYKETIESGVNAAVAGGFGIIVCMPNTDPPLDDHATVRWVIDEAKRCGPVRVLPIGSITKHRQGETLAEFGDMIRAGAVGFTDDGDPVGDSDLMRRAFEYAKLYDVPVFTHPEDKSLSRNGVMNEGEISSRLGLKGIPAAAEEIGIARDIRLAELTGSRLHVMHVSTAKGAELVRRAKEEGLRVTAETAPHYLALTEESLTGYDTNRKMNPPLRTAADRRGLRLALADGVFDAVATDHAPHAIHEKDVEFDAAPFGVVGLETALAVLNTYLVRPGHLSFETLIERLTSGPAGILGLDGHRIEEGREASITVLDPDRSWVVDPNRFESISRNTPFAGERLHGVVRMVVIGDTVLRPRSWSDVDEEFPAPIAP